MVKVIVDTSVLIDHLKNRSTHFLALINEKLSGEIELLIPYIAIIELYAGEDAKQKKAREAITKTLEGTSFIDLTLVSAQKAGELMRVYKQIPDPLDLIIAAIAIEQ
jgi:predicted nucleic acid-binding protein